MTSIGASAPDIQQTMLSSPGATGQISGAGTTNTGSTGLTFDQVENYWIQAGGNPQAAAMAAAVADAESGLNPKATRTNPNGTKGIGLWLIPKNGSPPGSTDPLSSARAAIQLSQNGTDWTQWCSSWSDNNCGQSGGTYLGSGANALMSLGTQSEPASYNQFGATPAGNGQGASGAVASNGGTGATGKTNYMLIAAVVVAIIVGVYIYRQRQGGKTETPPQEEQPG